MHTHEIIEGVFTRIAHHYNVEWVELTKHNVSTCQIIYQLSDYFDIDTICDTLKINRVQYYYLMGKAETMRKTIKEFNAIYLLVQEELKPDSKLKYMPMQLKYHANVTYRAGLFA